jgi:gluconate 2-dehydrogenase subunit 3-like protein
MGDKKELPMAGAGGVGRREMLQGLTALGAGLAVPGGVHAHLVAPARAAAKAKAAGGTLAFLDAHQFATLSRLCALIVPGSDTAGADRFIDELLAVAGNERQREFLTAFGAIEGAALERFQKPFKALAEPQQVEVLTAVSSGPSGGSDWTWEPGKLIERPKDGPQSTTTPRDHFDHLKRWIAEAYYTSEAGLKELGYTGNMMFAEFPDCKHPEHQ